MKPKIRDLIGEYEFLKTIFVLQAVITFLRKVVIYDNGSKLCFSRLKSFFMRLKTETVTMKLENRVVFSYFGNAFSSNAPLSYMTTFQNTVASPSLSVLWLSKTKTSPCRPVSILQNSIKYYDRMKTYLSIQAKCTDY